MPCQIHGTDSTPHSHQPALFQIPLTRRSAIRSEFTTVLFLLIGMSGFLVSIARLLACFPEGARHGSCSWKLGFDWFLLLAAKPS